MVIGMRRGSTESIHFQPRFFIESEPVPGMKNDESFLYHGRYFDFSMSNAKDRVELVDVLESFMSDIDKLPIHPKNKLLLYQNNILAFDDSRSLKNFGL